jgi:hypothetical protein
VLDLTRLSKIRYDHGATEHEEDDMAIAVQVKTKILPGHRVEVQAPELPVGCSATVFIVVEEQKPKRPFYDVVGDYPGQKMFKTAEEVDAYIRAERDSWD